MNLKYKLRQLHGRKKDLLKTPIYFKYRRIIIYDENLYLFLFCIPAKLSQCWLSYRSGSCLRNTGLIKVSASDGIESLIIIQGKECLEFEGLGTVDTGCSRDWYRKRPVTNIASSSNKYLNKMHLFQWGKYGHT